MREKNLLKEENITERKREWEIWEEGRKVKRGKKKGGRGDFLKKSERMENH